MNRIRNTLLLLLAMLVLTVSNGISFTRHICMANTDSACAEDENCCKRYHDEDVKSSACCEVKSFYVKANFISSGENLFQKLHLQFPVYHVIAFIAVSLSTQRTEKRCHAPPAGRSQRVILLSTSKLSV